MDGKDPGNRNLGFGRFFPATAPESSHCAYSEEKFLPETMSFRLIYSRSRGLGLLSEGVLAQDPVGSS